MELIHRPIEGPLDFRFARSLRGFDLVHVQYPTAGWGESVLPALLPAFRLAQSPKCRVLVTMHEWQAMNPLRKASVLPLLADAAGIVFVSPAARAAYESSAWKRLLRRQSWYVPIGMNLEVPDLSSSELLTFRSVELGLAEGERALGHFGFIYDAKQPLKMLEVLREMLDRGIASRLVLVGDFLGDKPQDAARFEQRAKELEVEDCVRRFGFVDDPATVALVMGSCDAIMLLFSDGLSLRRGSFWYAAALGTFVVTTTPEAEDEFAEYAGALAAPQVSLVDARASAAEIAGRLAAMPAYAPQRFPPVKGPEWSDIARRHLDIYAAALGGL